MSECDAILKNGIFNTIKIDTAREISENLYDWLRKTDYATFKHARQSGLKIGLPIDGVPLEIGNDVSEDDFNAWKSKLATGHTRSFTSDEALSIVQRSVSKDIVDAWRECTSHPPIGLCHYVSMGNDGDISITVRYVPNAPADLPPSVKSFMAVNATAVNPLLPKDAIPFAGVTVLLTRTRNDHGDYPEATVVINTTKGTVSASVPALLKELPQPAPALATRLFRAVSPVSNNAGGHNWPSVTVTVEPGYKVISGGARVNFEGAVGSLLTASYPSGPNAWTAKAKDHIDPCSASVEAWAIAIYDPADEWDVIISSTDSSVAAHPQALCTVPSGYAMTGGGAYARFASYGSLLTASYPIDSITWCAKSKDHEPGADEKVVLTAYAVGIKPRNGAALPPVSVSSVTSSPEDWPTATVNLSKGQVLLGGGAYDDYSGWGNMLTASYPIDGGWTASGKDHHFSDKAAITVYAIHSH